MLTEFHETELPGQDWQRRELVWVWVMAGVAARAWPSWAADGKTVQSCYRSPVCQRWGALQVSWPSTQILFPNEGDLTISKVGCRRSGIASSEIHVVNFLHPPCQVQNGAVQLLEGCGVGWDGASCAAPRGTLSILSQGMLRKSNQSLRAGSTVGQCAVRSAARAVGCSSGLQNPSSEYGNWGCSSRKYISEAPL